MSREAILALLATDAGLDPGSLGERVIQHALEDACREIGCDGEAALLAAMRAKPVLLRQLREHFLVAETWFFRAAGQFDDLCRFAISVVPQRRPFRVLCLPCASGEEAVSAVIALQTAGLLAADIEVVGVDLSEVALATARGGRYAANALRRHDPGEEWLIPEGNQRVVLPALRRCLRFIHGNALDPLLLAGEPGFDAIFCRNLMIYLLPAARRALLGNLRRLARQPTLLLAGHAENFAAQDPALRPMPGGDPLSFLLASCDRHNSAGEHAAEVRASATIAPRPPDRLLQNRQPWPAPSGALPAPAATAVSAVDVGMSEDIHAPVDAQALADAGQIDAAKARCLERLSAVPADVAHRFLLAMLEVAAERLDAADSALSRVLYLDPQHRGALEHRAAIARRRGDHVLAQRLAARLQRSRDRQGELP